MLSEEQAVKAYRDANAQTAIQVFESKQAAIALFENKDNVLAMIEYAIIDLMNFINVPRTMNEMQIKETARLILKKFGALTIPDIKLVFDRIKSGQFKIYEGLDGMKIMYAFDKWMDERMNAADDYSFNNHITTVGNEKRLREKPFMIGGSNNSLGENPKEAFEHEKIFERKNK